LSSPCTTNTFFGLFSNAAAHFVSCSTSAWPLIPGRFSILAATSIVSPKSLTSFAPFKSEKPSVPGRRRIGKTSLIWKAYENETFLYFFAARKAEAELCESYQLEIEQKLGIQTLGRVDSFAQLFEFILKLSVERPVTLFIDEFQEFFRVNKSIYSDMQRIWDMHQNTAHINLIVCGSIYQ
jgi:hypothetical protein